LFCGNFKNFERGMIMSQLALASLNHAPSGQVSAQASAQWAHDIRNALATVGLHLETLERLSGSRGREIALAAHALMSRAAAMCNEAMTQSGQNDVPIRRRGFDIVKTIVQTANLLRPTAPEGFEIRVAGSGAFIVLADPQDVFRILFNLVHNAITIARQGIGITHVTLLVERAGTSVTVRIADDGPGLPKAIRTTLFRAKAPSATGGSGLGLAIARELAERNGGVLKLADSARGATFTLELTGLAAMPAESGAMRSLGKRVQH
jgi:signal transduction histidine kinase